MEPQELLKFAKWLIHSRRLKFKYQDNINAHEYASNLMTELCHIEAFGQEHPLLKEYKEYKLRTETISVAEELLKISTQTK